MSELTEIVAPYRSDEDCRRESICGRIDKVRKAVLIKGEKLEDFPRELDDIYLTKAVTEQQLDLGGLGELLADLGYQSKIVQNSTYVDSHKLVILTRENENSVDVLVRKTYKGKDNSCLLYLNIQQDKLKQLEKDVLRSYSFGSEYSKKGLIKRLAEPAVLFGSLIGSVSLGVITGGVGAAAGVILLAAYSDLVNGEEYAYFPGLVNQSSDRRLKKQDIKTGTDALLSALYLPEKNGRK